MGDKEKKPRFQFDESLLGGKFKLLGSEEAKSVAQENEREKRTYTFEELYEHRDDEQLFLIPELIPTGLVCGLIGEDGIGKTQLLSQLCLSVCLGHDTFLGLPLHAPHKRCLVVATEDSRQKFTKAVVKILEALAPGAVDPAKIALKFTEGADFDTFDALVDEVVFHVSKAPHDIVVIDALSDLFTMIDGEINSNTHARKILSKLQTICNEHGCAIILIHHAAKTKVIELQKTGTIFINKNSSQGAGAITQKPRTILALSNDPKSISEDGKFYTNYLHVVKANVMGKQYVKNAIEMQFNGYTLVHGYTGMMDIEAYELQATSNPEYAKPITSRADKAILAGAAPVSTSLDSLVEFVFRAGKPLTRSELIYEVIAHAGCTQDIATGLAEKIISNGLAELLPSGEYIRDGGAPF